MFDSCRGASHGHWSHSMRSKCLACFQGPSRSASLELADISTRVGKTHERLKRVTRRQESEFESGRRDLNSGPLVRYGASAVFGLLSQKRWSSSVFGRFDVWCQWALLGPVVCRSVSVLYPHRKRRRARASALSRDAGRRVPLRRPPPFWGVAVCCVRFLTEPIRGRASRASSFYSAACPSPESSSATTAVIAIAASALTVQPEPARPT
jgi:hypothetical protein